jgi:hypothetical protein
MRRHPVSFALNLIVTFGSPFLGFALAGWSGVVGGLFLALVSWVAGERASSRIIVAEGSSSLP